MVSALLKIATHARKKPTNIPTNVRSGYLQRGRWRSLNGTLPEIWRMIRTGLWRKT
jgi:hypothetical protein